MFEFITLYVVARVYYGLFENTVTPRSGLLIISRWRLRLGPGLDLSMIEL